DLAFGLHWDRDYYVQLAITIRNIYWPLTLFIVHPLVIFIVSKSQMDIDCKVGYICHTTVLIFFDFYNCLLYQMYPLVPLPVFICTGLLCGTVQPKTMLTLFSVVTVAMGPPYLFLMMRMHQRMLSADSPLKMKTSTQVVLMLFFTTTFIANVYGFHNFTVDIPTKNVLINVICSILLMRSTIYHILQRPEIVWARNFSTNFLVLGERVGQIGPFGKGD
ncbi:hypothetical protein PFISCL1PPCAC_4526, partial [Pristionchus fissidentatus]